MPFLRNVPGLEAVYRDYAPAGVQFYLVYKSVVHPGTNGVVEAYTLAERLRQVAVARERLGTTLPWLCDAMDNAIQHALDAAPNGEFVVDAEGRILRKRFWHDPAALRAFLAERLGPVEPPTRVADLDMQLEFPARPVRRGVVPPLPMPGRMTALRVVPELQPGQAAAPTARVDVLGGALAGAAEDGAAPFFVKVRAEGDRELLDSGRGRLYLGFYLDPLYEVHWNNPAGGIRYRIEPLADDELEPVTGRAPDYAHETDIDPREFLVDLAAPRGASLRLVVDYTVCDDAETFCMPVQQRYTLTLARDPDGGTRAGDWMTSLVGDPMQFDADGDGRVTRDELPAARAQLILNHHDRNHDGAITPPEADLFHEMIRIGKGETGR